MARSRMRDPVDLGVEEANAFSSSPARSTRDNSNNVMAPARVEHPPLPSYRPTRITRDVSAPSSHRRRKEDFNTRDPGGQEDSGAPFYVQRSKYVDQHVLDALGVGRRGERATSPVPTSRTQSASRLVSLRWGEDDHVAEKEQEDVEEEGQEYDDKGLPLGPARQDSVLEELESLRRVLTRNVEATRRDVVVDRSMEESAKAEVRSLRRQLAEEVAVREQMQAQMEDVQDQVAQAQADGATREESARRLQEALASSQDDWTARETVLNEALREAHRALDKERQERASIANELEKAENDKYAILDYMQNSVERNARLEDENRVLQAQTKELQEEVYILGDEVMNLRSENDKIARRAEESEMLALQVDDIQQEANTLSTDAQWAHEQMYHLQREKVELQRREWEATEKLDDAVKDLLSMRDREKATASELARAIRENKGLKDEIESVRKERDEAQRLGDRTSRLIMENAELHQETEKAKLKVLECEETIESLQEEITDEENVREQLEFLRQENAEMLRQKAENKKEVEALRYQIQEFEEMLEQKTEEVEALQEQIVAETTGPRQLEETQEPADDNANETDIINEKVSALHARVVDLKKAQEQLLEEKRALEADLEREHTCSMQLMAELEKRRTRPGNVKPRVLLTIRRHTTELKTCCTDVRDLVERLFYDMDETFQWLVNQMTQLQTTSQKAELEEGGQSSTLPYENLPHFSKDEQPSAPPLEEMGSGAPNAAELSSSSDTSQKGRKEKETPPAAVGSVSVCCRLRPLFRTEHSVISTRDPRSLEITKGNYRRVFFLDRVYGTDVTQEDLASEFVPVINTVLGGQNVCVVAYGETGSGKSYTMEGTFDEPGLMPRLTHALFQRLADWSAQGTMRDVRVSVSATEVYMETARDLLVDPKSTEARSPQKRAHTAEFFPTSVMIESSDDFERVRELIFINRLSPQATTTQPGHATASGLHNAKASCVVMVTVEGFNVDMGTPISSQLTFVDLAGSEKPHVAGEPLSVTQKMNKGLMAVVDVLTALSRRLPYVPYRHSKLTHLLHGSLGSTAAICLIVCVSPSVTHFNEALSTLSFASQVAVTLNPESHP